MTKGIHVLTAAALLTVGMPAMLSQQQSAGTITQTVQQRHTLGHLRATPNGTVTAGDPITFNYTLETEGAPTPASETVQFYDGLSTLGTPQAIGAATGSNLIPYSQVNTAQGWTTSGTAPTVTPVSVNGPDGSTKTATAVTFTDGTSSVLYAVPSTTNYANKQTVFSVWAQSATPTTLNLTVSDNPFTTATQTTACAVTAAWQRCSVAYVFPANSGTGFSVSLSSSTNGIPIDTWGAQFEQPATKYPGPYVSTIGTARPTGGAAGTVTFPWTEFHTGIHTITVQYPGDTNYVASTSNAVVLNEIKEIPAVFLTDMPVGTSAYGTAVALTAHLSDQDNDDDWIPTGTVAFFDGATQIGSGTLDSSGKATVTIVGLSSLLAGSHSLTVQYSGDDDFDAATSPAITHVVTKADSSAVVATIVGSSLNPSIYGDTVLLSVNVTSSVGIQPTGTVTLVDGTTTLGTVTLDGSGNGALNVPTFSAGAHSIVATYSGDVNYF
jgi:hypothetical protein